MNIKKVNNAHALIFFAVLMFAPALAYSVSLQDVQSAGESFKDDAIISLPLSAASGLIWSDAYIGQFVSKIPHFGYGFAAALTSVKTDGFQSILNSTGANREFSGKNSMTPIVVFETRLGGALFPFDMGMKFGLIDNLKSGKIIENGFDRSFFLIGGDFRISVLKDSGRKPGISIGLGYNYLRGSMTSETSGGDFTYTGGTLTADPGELKLFWDMHGIEAKLQVSKKLLCFTPYLGAAATFYWANAGYELNANLTSTLPSNLSDITVTEKGFSSLRSNKTGMSARTFGGVSINIFVFRVDAAAMYDFFSKTYGLNLGLRIQV
jgi:hypothetical protein